MTAVKKLLATSDLFSAWLESHAPDAVVGHVGRAPSCPLATFLTARGIDEAEVYPGSCSYVIYQIRTRECKTSLPVWAYRLAMAVDEIGWADDPVTAAEVLAILLEQQP